MRTRSASSAVPAGANRAIRAGPADQAGTSTTTPHVGRSDNVLRIANTLAMIGTVGLTSPTNHYSGVGGPTGTSHVKRSDSGEITGSTACGFSWGAGSNT
jgi:hypothetical protein